MGGRTFNNESAPRCGTEYRIRGLSLTRGTTLSITAESGPFEMIPHWVLEVASANAIRLYLILRRYAMNKDTCFPSRATLAEEMKVSLDTLDRAKKELIEMGAITVKGRATADGGQTSNEYTVFWYRGGRKSKEGGAEPVRRGEPQTAATKETTSKQTTTLPTGFSEFWAAYPRREGKASAERAYRKVLSTVSASALIAAAHAYAAETITREKKFIKQPATWLNGGFWDAYETTPTQKAPTVYLYCLTCDNPPVLQGNERTTGYHDGCAP